MKIFTMKEAITKALQTFEQVEIKLKAAKVTIQRIYADVRIAILKPQILNGASLEYAIADEFICKFDVGVSAIAQAIDMHYCKIKPELINNGVTVMTTLRRNADICMINAKEVEMLLKGK